MSAKALFAFFAIMHGVQAQTSPPDGVVEVVMTADGQASDYGTSKKNMIKAAFAGSLAGMGIVLSMSDITVTVADGVTITTQMTLPAGTDASSVKDTFAQPAIQDALKTTLAAAGITVSDVSVTGAAGGGGGGGVAVVIIILVLLVAGGAITFVLYKKKKMCFAPKGKVANVAVAS